MESEIHQIGKIRGDQTSNNKYSCACGSVYKNKSSLVFHLKTHLEKKSFICQYCSKAFRNNIELEAHISYHTKKKLFICQKCGKECSTISALKSHQIVHLKRKIYKCDICDKILSHYSSLKNHIRNHSGLKPFACGICSKCFSQQQLLTLHMKMHSSDKPFECDTCGKKFARKQMLQCHFAVHTGEKAFKCKECPKRFAYQSDALKHQKIHSGIKPFLCSLCPAKFLRKGHLTRHMNIHKRKSKCTENKIEKDNRIENEKSEFTVAKSSISSEQNKFKHKFLKSNMEQRKIKYLKRDRRTIEIQFIANTINKHVSKCDNEYVEIKCKEELDTFMDELGVDKLWVSIGREMEDGSWEYEKVETTIEKVSPDSNEMKQIDADCLQIDTQNEDNYKTPWKCALCSSAFAEKLELILHVSEKHRESFKPKSVGIKLAMNKTSGEIEEKPLAQRHKFKTVSKDLIQPLYQKYFKKSVSFYQTRR